MHYIWRVLRMQFGKRNINTENFVRKYRLGFNYKGALNCVYHYTDGDAVYVDLWKLKGDTVEKGCIAKLSLKTGAIEKQTDDDTICNSVMSPGGNTILLNYRAEGYWTVLDLAAKTEKKVEGINGYARTKEISFVDDYHVLAFGDTIIKDKGEILVTNLIDLRTQKTMKSYKEEAYGDGDIQMRWIYECGKKGLKIRDITNGESFTVEQAKEDVHPLSVRGDYVLFGNLEERTPFYLCSLSLKKHIKIDVPEKLGQNVQMYLAAKEKKLLFTDGRECYLVDIAVLTVK